LSQSQAKPSPRPWLWLWLEESEAKARLSQAKAGVSKPSQAKTSLLVLITFLKALQKPTTEDSGNIFACRRHVVFDFLEVLGLVYPSG
jgi:hypothetical protein